jgi:hypothetical protein
MKRSLLYIVIAVAVVVSSVGVYHVLSTSEYRGETQRAEASSDQNMPPTKPAPPRPDHGNFQKRFEPVPPPSNGGRLN